MTEDHELDGLDPFAILDREAARLDAFFSDLAVGEWARPSRCAGWSVRDVLAHLAAGEEYHRASLDGTVAALLEKSAQRGASDMDAFNALGVADRAQMSPDELLAEWRAANAESRRRFRQRGDGSVDTTVGQYPCRLQAFHVASELATHADDVEVPVEASEREARLDWRARFSRFALAEAKPHLAVEVVGARTAVTDGSVTTEVDDEDLVDAVMGRLDATSPLAPAARRMLSTMT